MKDTNFERNSYRRLSFDEFFEQCLTLIEERNQLPFEQGTPEEMKRLLKPKFIQLFFVTTEPTEAVKMHFLSIEAMLVLNKQLKKSLK